jgi:hypothetical protein
MNRYTEILDSIERRIATDGLQNHDADLATIANILVRTGTLPTVAGILTDPTQPEPARMRALARATRAIRAADGPSLVPARAA